jgi:hypothetical protein
MYENVKNETQYFIHLIHTNQKVFKMVMLKFFANLMGEILGAN